MNTSRMILPSLFLAWSLLAPHAGFAQDNIRWENGRAICESTYEWDSVPGNSLSVEVSSMDVTVTGGTAIKVVMVEKIVLDVANEDDAKKYYQKFRVELKKSGDDFHFRSPQTENPFRGGSLKFQIPAVFNANLTTSGGDLEIEDIKGNVNLSTSGGDIKGTSVTGNANLSTSGGDIDIRSMEGIVNAMTSGGDIQVAHCSPKIAVSTSGGDIDLSHVSGTLKAATSGGDIMLTDLDGDADLSSSGGDLDITDVKASKSVKATTSGGDIIAQDIAADVSLATSSGDLDLKNIAGSVDATTSNGDVSGNNIEGQTVNAYTSSGDISLENIRGAVTVVTSNGDLSLKMKKSAESYAIELTTSGGDVSCILPTDYKGSVRARIEGWSKYSSDDITSDFPLMIGTENSHTRIATGDINGGGPSIRIETAQGDIRLQKYSEP